MRLLFSTLLVLTAASVAALTLYDMCKAVQKDIVLGEIRLLYKAGGMMARAHASFRRVLELRPDHREAAAELGVKPPAAPGPPPGGLLKRLFGRGKAS